MIEFWLIAALLTLGALGLVVTPMLRHRDDTHATDTTAVNTRLYQERVRELDGERANGNLDAADYATARDELARELLHDTEPRPTPVAAGSGGKWAAAVVAIAVPLLSIGLYQQLGAGDLLTELDADSARSQAPQHPPMAATGDSGLPPVQDMVAGLAAKMAQNPDNADGWQLLARSYMTLKRYGEAEAAYARAHALAGDQPTLLVNYAEAMALARDGRLGGEPAALIEKALAIAPDHPEALWLGGMAAYQVGELPTAGAHLHTLLRQLEAGSPDAQMVQAQIARIEEQLEGPLDPIVPPVAVTPPTPAAPPTQERASAGPRITVSVDLDETLRARTTPGDTVFIYARAPAGPRMPLAMSRHTVAELPVTVTLTDAMAMMPAMKLSSFEKVMVMARVSKSGNAMTQSGDMVGSYGPVAITRMDPVAVTINEYVQ